MEGLIRSSNRRESKKLRIDNKTIHMSSIKYEENNYEHGLDMRTMCFQFLIVCFHIPQEGSAGETRPFKTRLP